MDLKELLELISPILVRPSSSSITISISKRFFLFMLAKKIVNVIEEDPYLNFIALLKSYKILGTFLNGTIHDFYRDRNKIYFKKFFYDADLYSIVKEDIESLYPEFKDIRMTITKRGVIVYDNYKKNSFNILLLTIHSGRWVPKEIKDKLSIDEDERHKEEDIFTDRIYRDLVLKKGGIWIDNKQSRFVIDLNRNLARAIYADNSEEWLNVVWKTPLKESEKKEIYASYKEFYFTLSKLIESYSFNIIFDAHSMNNIENRPSISLGTEYIPRFYMPIVMEMKKKLLAMGYKRVELDNPYRGGNILRWMNVKFPNVFIFSMEINKKIYMKRNINTTYKKIKKLSSDVLSAFEFNI